MNEMWGGAMRRAPGGDAGATRHGVPGHKRRGLTPRHGVPDQRGRGAGRVCLMSDRTGAVARPA